MPSHDQDRIRLGVRERGLDDPIELDVQGRVQLWLAEFTRVTFDECVAAQGAIEQISPRRHSYSMPRTDGAQPPATDQAWTR